MDNAVAIPKLKNVLFFIPTNVVQVTERLSSSVSNKRFCESLPALACFPPFLPTPAAISCTTVTPSINAGNATWHAVYRSSQYLTITSPCEELHACVRWCIITFKHTATMYLADGQHSYVQTTKRSYFAHQWWQPVPLRPSAHWRFFAAAVEQPQRLLQ